MLKMNFNHTSRSWGCDEKFHMMIWKGVYPYKYMDDGEKFEETSLPPKDAFYSRLNVRGIGDQDYKHAQQVWNTMEKKTLECCHDMYLKIDALLLADVSETFQDTLLKDCGLDPAQFLHHTWIGMAVLIKDIHRVLWAWRKAKGL